MVWYEQPSIAHRLGHPFVHPGGPSVLAEPAAARRQTVQQFQEQAATAWTQLQQAVEGTSQEPEQQPQQQQQQPQQQQLDLSGLAVPPLPRKRLTGPVMLVPQPEPSAPGSAPPAAPAAPAVPPGQHGSIEVLAVPGGCLQLHSWQESAAAEEPPGEVAGSSTATGVSRRAAAGARGGAAARAAAAASGVLQPGSEVVITLAVMDTSRRLSVVQQEIQALGCNTLADIRDAISCPTDQLAEGLGASNPAAYFYIDRCFYDDTRAAAAAECSQVVQHWVQRLGLSGPRHLLQHFEQPEEQQEDAAAAAAAGVPSAPAQQQQQQHAEQQAPGGEEQQQGSRRDMQRVRLSELVLQASNRPMVIFSHQGLCEHAVVVTDVRLLHPSDALARGAYPRTLSQAALSRRLQCGLCKKLGATALLLHHPETPEAVTLLCRLCCGLFGVGAGGAAEEAQLIMLEPF